MKKPEFLAPLYLNEALLMPIIWATAIFGEGVLNRFVNEEVDSENVKYSAKGGKKI